MTELTDKLDMVKEIMDVETTKENKKQLIGNTNCSVITFIEDLLKADVNAESGKSIKTKVSIKEKINKFLSSSLAKLSDKFNSDKDEKTKDDNVENSFPIEQEQQEAAKIIIDAFENAPQIAPTKNQIMQSILKENSYKNKDGEIIKVRVKEPPFQDIIKEASQIVTDTNINAGIVDNNIEVRKPSPDEVMEKVRKSQHIVEEKVTEISSNSSYEYNDLIEELAKIEKEEQELANKIVSEEASLEKAKADAAQKESRLREAQKEKASFEQKLKDQIALKKAKNDDKKALLDGIDKEKELITSTTKATVEEWVKVAETVQKLSAVVSDQRFISNGEQGRSK